MTDESHADPLAAQPDVGIPSSDKQDRARLSRRTMDRVRRCQGATAALRDQRATVDSVVFEAASAWLRVLEAECYARGIDPHAISEQDRPAINRHSGDAGPPVGDCD